MNDAVENLKTNLARYLVIDDWQAVDILLSVVAAHKIGGDMLWLRVIGSSASGKTELIRMLMTQEDYCFRLECFTPAAIRRGYRNSQPKLLELLDGKLAVTKEFNTMLTKNKDTTLETYGLLRAVHDGELAAAFGSDEGNIEIKTWFDWILAVTTYIVRQSGLEQQLGSRFLNLRWGKALDKAAVMKMMMDNSNTYREDMRVLAADGMTDVINSVNPKTLKMPELDYQYLTMAADLIAKSRTPVERNRYEQGNPVNYVGDTEGLGRLGQSFARIIKGLALLGQPNYKPYINRIVWDNIPPDRATILKAGLKVGTLRAATEISRQIGNVMALSKVSTILEDLRVIEMNIEDVASFENVTSETQYEPKTNNRIHGIEV